MLTTRQETILSLIIQIFTSTGHPVGSKRLIEEGIQASSATIRNDMKVLEEHGFILKSHSSSGRTPSISGYRYYVDHLLQPLQIRTNEVQLIRESLQDDFREINDLVRQSADILAHLTSYTALSLGPDIKERKLTGFKIVPLNDRQIVAIIVTDRGNVESQVFSIPESVSSADLTKMVAIINDRLVGQPMLTVYHKLRTEIPMILQRYYQTPEGIMALFDNALGRSFEEKIFVGGRMNLLNLELANDVDQFKSMYSLMKDSEEMTQLLTPSDDKIHIRIGSELGNELFDQFSLIQANYEIPGHGKGAIALLGPTSMPYSRMLGLVDVFRQELSHALANYYQSLD